MLYTSALKPFVIDGTDLDFLIHQVHFRPLFDAAGNVLFGWDGKSAIYDSAGHLLYDAADTSDSAAAAAMALWGTSYQTVTDLDGLRDVTGHNNNLTLSHSHFGETFYVFNRTVAANFGQYVHAYGNNEAGSDYGAHDFYWRYSTGSSASGSGTFNAGGTLNTDYTVSAGGDGSHHATDGSVITINNVVDYTPRMISRTVTTGGVTYALDANGHIAHDANGVATVTDWGVLATAAEDPDNGLGQLDPQARMEGSAGIGDHFIGGLNPGVSPSNGFFVLFGQFFDHGLDFIDKAGGATIKIALATDDPMYGMIGPDGQPVHEITITRATVNDIGPNGPNYVNNVSPFIDQSQTYGSVSQVTMLLREWVLDPVTGQYKAGMGLLDGTTLANEWTRPDGTSTHDTLPTLNELRDAVIATGRDALTWDDVLDYRNRDDHGHLSGGNSGSALLLDMNPRFDTAHLLNAQGESSAEAQAVLDAIATLNANFMRAGDTFGFNSSGVLTLHLGSDLMTGPTSSIPAGTDLTGASALALWVDFSNFSIMQTPPGVPSQFVDTVRDAVSNILMASVGDHYIAGDGRVNENFGLTSIHHVFHEEHNFQVGNLIEALHAQDAHLNNGVAVADQDHSRLHSFQTGVAAVDGATLGAGISVIDGFYQNAAGDWTTAEGTINWDTEAVFQGAKLIVEMEYQHAAVDQYARNVSPNIQEFVGYTTDVNPDVTLEYSQVAFRFGHSTLRETIDTIDPSHGLTGRIMGYALEQAFLNPEQYAASGPSAVLLGMTHQQMNEVDEFLTPALNQGLLGQPLDLAAINIARGRDIGIPTLNAFRAAIGLSQYESWFDFGQNMQHPGSLANFIAAYSFDGNLAKAAAIVGLADGTIAEGDAAAMGYTLDQAITFLHGGDQGFNAIDTWLGGLAEIHQPGGLLGETFDTVFVSQIEALMDGDRFYYLYRLAGQQFGQEVANGQLKDLVERNTGLTHLNGNIFGYADEYYDLGAHRDTSALVANGGQATDLTDSTTRNVDGVLLIDTGNTTNNDHAYGDVSVTVGDAVLQVGTDIGIYSHGGSQATHATDGGVITIGGVNYVRDTRAIDPVMNAMNGGVNLDGTPNSGAESNEVIVATNARDMIYAQGGDDTVYGEGGDDFISGGFGIDRLYGGDGADTIRGGDNPDLIDGGAGDDVLYGESSGTDINGSDQVIGGSGNDFISGGTGIDKLTGGLGDDEIHGDQDTDPFTHGDDGNDIVDGGSGGDICYGDNGDDLVIGGRDQDQIFGGNGDDILRPGDPTGALTIGTDEVLGGDGVTDEGNEPGTIGFDIVDFSDNSARPNGVTFDLGNQQNPATTANGTPTQIATFQLEGVVGSLSGDTLLAGDDDNWIIGGSGDDVMVAGGGFNVVVGGSIRLDALIGHYESAPGVASDYGYTDDFEGASHRVGPNDQLVGGLLQGADLTSGGEQIFASHFTEMLKSQQFRNLVLGDSSADAAASSSAGSDTVVFSGNVSQYTFLLVDRNGMATADPAQVFAVMVTGNGETTLVVGCDTFRFADGDKSLNFFVNHPGSGTFSMADDVVGGAPILTGSVIGLTDPDNVTGANPTGAVTSAVTLGWQLSNDNGATWTAASSTADIALPNLLNAQVRIVASYTDAQGHSDKVYSDVWHAGVGDDSNNLVVGSNDAATPDVLFGRAGNDILMGYAGNDRFHGGVGDDVIDGGDGIDKARFAGLARNTSFGLTATGAITVSNSLSGNDTVANVERFQFGTTIYALVAGTNGIDALGAAGGTDPSLILGFGGFDTLTGGNYDDVLDGGDNNDVITGGAGADTGLGGAGNDTFMAVAGDGDDRYEGGIGNDMYNAASIATSVVVDLSAGSAVGADIGTDLLVSIENVLGGSASDTLTGSSARNHLVGGAGDDVLKGLWGNDVLEGGIGNDTFVGTANDGNDSYDGGVGIDTLDLALASLGGWGFVVDLMAGTSVRGLATDTLTSIENVIGSARGDTLIGGLSANVFTGGAGADEFAFGSVAAANGDAITDFLTLATSATAHDVLNLAGIDANTAVGGDQAFLWDSAASVTGNYAQGHLGYRYETIDGVEHTFVEGNTSGAEPGHDFSIDLIGHLVFATGSDLML